MKMFIGTLNVYTYVYVLHALHGSRELIMGTACASRVSRGKKMCRKCIADRKQKKNKTNRITRCAGDVVQVVWKNMLS